MYIIAIILGYLCDFLWGDPAWLWHPICGIGTLIQAFERWCRRYLPKTPKWEIFAGGCLWVMVCTLSFGIPYFILWGAGKVHWGLAFFLETYMCFQIFARTSLCRAGKKVLQSLQASDIPKARCAVAEIVGRDTQSLSQTQIIKATVETIAENTTDGIVAPLFYLLLGGAPLGFFYKAVNTMDSMLGYKNERYLYFGRIPAKMDDVLNFLPARITAVCMILASFLLRLDGKQAFRMWRRDRRKHSSPNAAQTESVCAGALQVQLAGNASYFGKIYEKPTLGDSIRPIVQEDILKICDLATLTSTLALFVGIVIWCGVEYLRGIIW